MSTFDLIAQDIEAYCEEHSTPESELLYRLNRQTHLETLNPRMLSGQLQGLFLRFIATMMRPRYILEVGTFTGYSSICLSEGLPPDGELHTIEMNEEYEDRIRDYFAQADRRDNQTALGTPDLFQIVHLGLVLRQHGRGVGLVAQVQVVDELQERLLVAYTTIYIWRYGAVVRQKELSTVV